ncbi:hypothetical protein BUALT_Bualt05G0103400 [Buddleja alternifolia]|uniref:CRAL-TRIO domain-containing protein n=1 Tax=Buddleja alternifolia TaxID=168488 RepID=A0AAV6XRA6_9LAMI|nr:hypothetical protein BUALT_Bualt05G0103400 [Buddleja alternifolia]
MDEIQELAVAQMRRSVHMLGSSTEKYRDPTLLRFLIARSMEVEKAAKMFVQWQKWRASFVPLNYIPDSEVEDELKSEKIYLQGLSRKGHPVLNLWFIYWIKPLQGLLNHDNNLIDKSFISSALKKQGFYFLRLVSADFSSFRGKEIGNEKLIGVLDLKQISYKNVDARALITGFQFLQAYYPERLAKCYIIHMPRFFVTVWKFVSRFLEKATLEKIVIVSKEEERREFVRDVGEEALPEEYGGQAKLVLLQNVVLTPPSGTNSSTS